MKGLARKRENGPSAARIGLALALVACAVALPPSAAAAELVGRGSPLFADVRAGVWALKALLLLHGLLVWVAGGWRPAPGGGVPLTPEAGPRVDPLPRGAVVVALPLILLAAAALRVPALDSGPWFDEIFTWLNYVQPPVGETLALYDSQNQHMLYTLAAKGAAALFGSDVWTLRLPAVVFGVASIAASYAFGRRVAGRTEGLLAAAFLAFSYHHVWFSQNARGYTGLLLWTIVATAVLVELLRRERLDGWTLPVLYAASMALAAFTHLTAVLVAVAHAAVAGWLLVRRGSRRPAGAVAAVTAAFLLAATFTLQLYALVLPQLLGTLLAPTMAVAGVEWQDPTWMVLETVRGLARGLPGGLLTVAVGSAVLLAGTLDYARRSPAVVALMILPVALTAAAILATGHNLWPRFFFFAAGFAALLVMRGLFVLARSLGSPGPRVATAAGAALALASAVTVPRAWGPKQDFRAAAAFVDRSAEAGDAVVTVDMATIPVRDHLARDWPEVTSDEELRAVEASHGRTWALYTFPTRLEAQHPGLWTRLRRDYRVAGEFPGTVRGGAVVVMVRERG